MPSAICSLRPDSGFPDVLLGAVIAGGALFGNGRGAAHAAAPGVLAMNCPAAGQPLRPCQPRLSLVGCGRWKSCVIEVRKHHGMALLSAAQLNCSV